MCLHGISFSRLPFLPETLCLIPCFDVIGVNNTKTLIVEAVHFGHCDLGVFNALSAACDPMDTQFFSTLFIFENIILEALPPVKYVGEELVAIFFSYDFL